MVNQLWFSCRRVLGSSWKQSRAPYAQILSTLTSLIEFTRDLLLLEVESCRLGSQVSLLRESVVLRQYFLNILSLSALLTLVAEYHLAARSDMVLVHLRGGQRDNQRILLENVVQAG